MKTRHTPSCSCCESCEVPPPEGGDYWLEVSGDWDIVGRDATILEDGVIRTWAAADDSPDNYMKATVSMFASQSGAKAAILLAYEDANNYLAAEVTFGDGAGGPCGSIRLYQRSGGVETTLYGASPVEGLTECAALEDAYSVSACFGFAHWQPELGNVFSMTVPAPNGLTRTITASGVTVASASPTYAGLLADELTSTDFNFSNWHWLYVKGAYDHLLCPQCGAPSQCFIMEAPGELPSCEWDEESGAGDFDTATLRTSVPFARLITEVKNPVLSTNGHIEADVEFDTAGDSAFVILGWYDSNNYCYAKVTVGEECGEIAIVEVVGGSLTETSQVMMAATTGCRLTMCFDLIGGSAKLIVTPDDTFYVPGGGATRQVQADVTVHAEGYKAGLAVGNITGEVTFRQWGWFLTTVESSLCEPCHSCTQHSDDFQRHYDPPTLGCEWDLDTHALTLGGSGHKLVLAPGETVTSQITLYGIGVVAEVGYDFPGDPTSFRLNVGDKWAEVDDGILRDSQGQEDEILPGDKVLRLCLHDGVSRASVGSVSAFVTSSATPSTKVVSITNTGSENLDILHFNAVARSIDDDICLGCASQCASCIDDAWPSTIIVDVSGVSGSWVCCGDVNGTYYLEDNGSVSNPIAVEWCAVIGIKCRARIVVECEDKTIGVYVYVRKNGLTVELWVVIVLDDGSFAYIAIWKKTLTTTDGEVNCLTLSEVLTDSDLHSTHTNNGTVNGACTPSGWLCGDASLSGIVINVQAV